MRKNTFARTRNKYGQKLVDELLANNNCISWDTWATTDFKLKNPNIFVTGTCISCGSSFKSKTKQVAHRVYIAQTCVKCSLAYATNLPECRKNNSDAQLLIQGTPEQKRKNADGVAKFWKENPEKLKIASEQSKARHRDPVYAARWGNACRDLNFQALSGRLLFRNSWMKFGSAYELCFLLWIEPKSEFFSIRRSCFEIKYHFDGDRRYWPDYEIVSTDGTKILVEIKSTFSRFYDKEKQDAKEKAVQALIESGVIDKYELVHEEHPWASEIRFRRTSAIKRTCKELWAQGKIRLDSDKKHKSYIGTGRLRNENKKNHEEELLRPSL